MDVYLVPTGGNRHELYCEVPDEPVVEADDAQPAETPNGVFGRLQASVRAFFARLRGRFDEMLAEAERERRQATGTPPQGGWLTRLKSRTMRWVAESIAEQRLLWHLRSQAEAYLSYPDDVDEPKAMSLLRAQLSRDFERHRFWLIIDTLLFVASGLLALVPGPNLLAYYFAFRLVGHYLSMRGARQGLKVVTWRTEKSAPLTDLRRAIGLDPSVREQRVHEVAGRLRLEHLASFFQRAAVPQS